MTTKSMVFSVLFMTVQFCTTQVYEQSSTGEQQLRNELPSSVHFYQQEDVESSSLHLSQPKAIKTPLTDQDIESLSAGSYQPGYTSMHRAIANPEAQQQEFPSALDQEAVVVDTEIESVDTDLGTYLGYGDLGPLSVDDINVEALSLGTDMELSLNDTYEFWNSLTTDAKHQQNSTVPFEHSHPRPTFPEASNEKPRNVNGEGDENMASPTFGGSAGEQTFGTVRSISGQNLAQAGNAKHSFLHRVGKNSFRCDMCPKEFRTSSDCKRHRRKHIGEKPFKCDFCQNQFSDPSNCQRHRRIHTNQKPFQCDICPKQFRTSADFKTHRRIHTDEKPYQCDICSKEFRTISHYYEHRRIHTGQKPFQCDLCPKEFRTSGSYQIHRRTHTGESPYQCDICSRQFRTSNHCRRHRLIHTDEKPFQCDICSKQFRTSDDYRKHRRIHTGKKLFKYNA